MVCAGCGAAVSASETLPFRCPQAEAGDDIDHLLRCELAPEGLHEAITASVASAERSPFLRFRRLMHSYRFARRQGMSDAEYCELVSELDSAVAQVDGVGFVETPYIYSRGLDLWVKDETGNVAGSHKARHLMGLAIHLEVVSRLGLACLGQSELVIASCGNAALAAAVVARAAGRRLRVFVPPSASPLVLRRLRELGALREVCARKPGDPPGDPCYRRFRAAIKGGALPFSCQGGDNGLTIQGGLTLGLEIAIQHRARASSPLAGLFVQVGGGALASGVFQGLQVAERGGLLPRRPRLCAVQTANAHPLLRAFVRARLRARASDPARAIAEARRHRHEYMMPWPDPPESIAEGILDDETYDWAAIVEALLETDGEVVLADEGTLLRARDLVERELELRASATGTAGVAGVLAFRAAAASADDMLMKPVAALITGVRR